MYWQSLWFGAPGLVRQPRGFFLPSEELAIEIPMATALKSAQQRAVMAAKEERARDAALAMQEYEAEKLAIRVKTARLRALRLAKEAETNARTKRKNPRWLRSK
jgi:hypothetical protein